MRRLFPSPALSALLFLVWPVLNQSWSFGQLALGAALALIIPWFTEALRPDKVVVRHPMKIVRLGLVVVWDIVTANVEVARRILGPESAIHPRYVWIPLSISDPHGVVALAGIISMTPGTLSSELSDDRRHLMIHVLSLSDEAELIAGIKARYERPLQCIFEGSSE